MLWIQKRSLQDWFVIDCRTSFPREYSRFPHFSQLTLHIANSAQEYWEQSSGGQFLPVITRLFEPWTRATRLLADSLLRLSFYAIAKALSFVPILNVSHAHVRAYQSGQIVRQSSPRSKTHGEHPSTSSSSEHLLRPLHCHSGILSVIQPSPGSGSPHNVYHTDTGQFRLSGMNCPGIIQDCA